MASAQADSTAHTRQAELLCAAGASVLVGTAIIVAGDLPRAYQGALIGAALGSVILAAARNRTLTLAVLWVLLHPLSIEKVFLFGTPLLPSFLPPSIVVSASDVAFVALFAVMILKSIFTADRPFTWPSLATPFAALALWTALMAMRTPSMQSALATVQALKMLLFIVVFSSAITTRRELTILLGAMAVAIGLQSLLVLRFYLTGQSISFAAAVAGAPISFSGSAGENVVRAIGTVGHVNQQASFHAFFTLPLLGLFALPRRWLKTLLFAVIALSLFAIIVTYSRTAWLAIAVGGIAVAVAAWRTGRMQGYSWFYLGLALLIVCGICAANYRPIIDRLLIGDQGATASRARAVALALDLAAAHPVAGVGPGHFVSEALHLYPHDRIGTTWLKKNEVSEARRYGRIEIVEVVDERTSTLYVVPLAVHNKFLLVLAELGSIGLALFLWFQLAVLASLVRGLRRCSGAYLWAGIGIMGAFFATQAYMAFDLFSDDKPMAILLFTAILAACYERTVSCEARS